MAGPTLKNILRPGRGAAPLIAQLLNQSDGNVCVEDLEGNLLLQSNGSTPKHSCAVRAPVKLKEDVIGFVCALAPTAELCAAILSWVAEKEAETKQLGAEVLNAYREINLIYRFSEKLTTLLGVESVADASVAQACQVVKAGFGTIFLLNPASGTFEAIASLIKDSLPRAILAAEGLIGAIAACGNGEIINDVISDARRSDKDPPVSSLICVPLKMKGRTQGLLVVGSLEPAIYTAGDLKLLSTLGVQIATAIENAMLYEKTLEAAKAQMLQQTLVEVEEQKRKAENMLLNILPASVAKELQESGEVQPMYFEDVTVCFTDFVGFSKATMAMATEDVVMELHKYFTAFDHIIERYGLEKLKTIGDSYMFVGGLPNRRGANPVDAVLAAIEIVETVRSFTSAQLDVPWRIRVGLHTGPVMAGVVGIHKFAFDIWGETVNVASRMESCGEPDAVNISDRTSARVKDFVTLQPRGRIKTKEGQDIEMYFVTGVQRKLLEDRSAFPPPRFEERYRKYFNESTPSFPAHLFASNSQRA